MTLANRKSDRVASVDMLRGLAIVGMVLCSTIGWGSGLPAWMFHAQVPPPDYIFNPEVRGITWVDLVFPFFLFSMGAALPFSLSRKLESGMSIFQLVLGLAKRWFILIAFSIVLGNARRITPEGSSDVWLWLFKIALWLGLFLTLVTSRKLSRKTAAILHWSGLTVIVALAFAAEYLMEARLSLGYSDIIIMILAYVAFLGGLIWILSRKSPVWRWVAFSVVFTLKAISSYSPEWLDFITVPDGISWIFRFKFFQYLIIAIVGMTVGDMIMKYQKTELPDSGTTGVAEISAAVAAGAAVIVQLWGLFTRHIVADLSITFVLFAVFLSIILYLRKSSLWSRVVLLGFVFLLAGIIFDPIDGGIRKDHCNLSYLLTTSGMAAIVCGIFIYSERSFGCKGGWLSECGQNPMIAYTVTAFLTLPLLSLSCVLPYMDSLTVGSPLFGMLRGVIVTGIMMAITVFITRKRIYWRS